MELNQIVKDFIGSGWIVTVIGGLGMFARLILGTERMSCMDQFKRILAAAAFSTIAWFILEQVDVSSLTKAISYGIVGVISPEVLQGIVTLSKRFAKKPEQFLKKKQ
jgi:hypothetical protein